MVPILESVQKPRFNFMKQGNCCRWIWVGSSALTVPMQSGLYQVIFRDCPVQIANSIDCLELVQGWYMNKSLQYQTFYATEDRILFCFITKGNSLQELYTFFRRK